MFLVSFFSSWFIIVYIRMMTLDEKRGSFQTYTHTRGTHPNKALETDVKYIYVFEQRPTWMQYERLICWQVQYFSACGCICFFTKLEWNGLIRFVSTEHNFKWVIKNDFFHQIVLFFWKLHIRNALSVCFTEGWQCWVMISFLVENIIYWHSHWVFGELLLLFLLKAVCFISFNVAF